MNQEMLQDLEREARKPITAGLSGPEAVQVEQLFASLLGSILEAINRSGAGAATTVARRTGQDLIRRTAAVAPNDRADFLAKETLDHEIRQADIESFALARKVFVDPAQRELLAPRAQSILADVVRLRDEIVRFWPGLAQRHGRVLSETALDCQYVMAPTEKTSLRLGKLIRAAYG